MGRRKSATSGVICFLLINTTIAALCVAQSAKGLGGLQSHGMCFQRPDCFAFAAFELKGCDPQRHRTEAGLQPRQDFLRRSWPGRGGGGGASTLSSAGPPALPVLPARPRE